MTQFSWNIPKIDMIQPNWDEGSITNDEDKEKLK